MVTLVPERREEVTTEGGLDVTAQADRTRAAIERFHAQDIPVSLFIDPEHAQIRQAKDLGADFVELHTGAYANAGGRAERAERLAELAQGAAFGREIGLVVNAGHGLTYNNVTPIVERLAPHELHIGHSIIARAVFVGLRQAVGEMKDVISRAQMLNPSGE